MMPASTTLASSQPRWGDQKAPITATPETSQNPFRHLVGRGTVRKREQEVAGRTCHSPSTTDQSGRLHWSSRLPVCRRASLPGSGSSKEWPRLSKCLARSNKSRTGIPATNKRRQRGAIPLGAANWRSPRCGVSALPVFHRPLAARVEQKPNMSCLYSTACVYGVTALAVGAYSIPFF